MKKIKIAIILNEKKEVTQWTDYIDKDLPEEYEIVECTQEEFNDLSNFRFFKYIDNKFVRNHELEEQNRLAQEHAVLEQQKQLTNLEQQKLQLINTKALANIELSVDEVSFINEISEKLT